MTPPEKCREAKLRHLAVITAARIITMSDSVPEFASLQSATVASSILIDPNCRLCRQIADFITESAMGVQGKY